MKTETTDMFNTLSKSLHIFLVFFMYLYSTSFKKDSKAFCRNKVENTKIGMSGK